MTEQIRERIRSDAKTLMVLAENEVFDRFNETREKYKKKLEKYAGRHPLTAKSTSFWDLDAERDQQANNATALSKVDLKCSFDKWKETFLKEKMALNEINSITSYMSSELLNWEKYIDDKRRLNVALFALVTAILINGGDKIWQHLWSSKSPSRYMFNCYFPKDHMTCAVTPSQRP